MSVLTYLQGRASDAVLSSSEKNSIATSISTLKTRLGGYFGTTVADHFQFGSSTRETILPRKMDENSDIDYMVVFAEGGYTPQTYLDRLKRFVTEKYSTSEVYQSSPTVVLELNHIKFELVPALKYGAKFKIPNGPSEWQVTDPNDFNNALVAKNGKHGYMVKPTIRLVKYWNACNGWVFDSFSLEKWIIDRTFAGCSNQRDYLFHVFDQMPTGNLNQTSKDKVERAKKIVKQVRAYEDGGQGGAAETEVKKLIPT